MEEGLIACPEPGYRGTNSLGLAELKNKFALTGPIPGSDAGILPVSGYLVS